MRHHKRPPEGTSRIISEEAEQRIERLADQMGRQSAARSQDFDLVCLDEALRTKDVKFLRILIPLLKRRYGRNLWKIYKGTPR